MSRSTKVTSPSFFTSITVDNLVPYHLPPLVSAAASGPAIVFTSIGWTRVVLDRSE